MSRHVTTRYLAHAFWYRKKSYVLCRACGTTSATQHVATSATRPSRRARQARNDERDRRETQLILLCNVCKDMIAVIRFNKRITAIISFNVSYFSNLLEYIFIQFILFDVNRNCVCKEKQEYM